MGLGRRTETCSINVCMVRGDGELREDKIAAITISLGQVTISSPYIYIYIYIFVNKYTYERPAHAKKRHFLIAILTC